MNNIPTISRSPGLYIHIPICKTRCRYCNFYSRSGVTAELTGTLIECICKEIESARWEPNTIDTIYLGGGTPSVLDPVHLKSILDSVRKRFIVLEPAEITLEANPGDLDSSILQTWLNMGINRVSLGVQSLDDAALRLLGRRHHTEQALTAMAHLARISKEKSEFSWSADVIMGIPNQSQRVYESSLERILTFNPPHLSCYQLTFESGTPLMKTLNRGLIDQLDEETEAIFFSRTQSLLAEHGYWQYEVSNYCSGIDSHSHHNAKYWDHVPYLGIGPSAHSFDGVRRWWIVSDIREYCRRIIEDGEAVEEVELIDSRTMYNERIMLGLRTAWGIDRSMIDASIQPDILNVIKAGLIRATDDRLIPTPLGMAVADSIAGLLIARTYDQEISTRSSC
ncbi:radical SAM family heme chaperone HemW [bacterium]|nr:radical SAM family heme chaperone HemW [candidate division CSSED10-310 bacterium]